MEEDNSKLIAASEAVSFQSLSQLFSIGSGLEQIFGLCSQCEAEITSFGKCQGRNRL